MNFGNNGLVLISLVIVGALFLYMWFTNQQAYPNEGSLTMNQVDPMTEVENVENYPAGTTAGVAYESVGQPETDRGDGYPPNGNVHLVGQTREGDYTRGQAETQGATETSCYPKDQLTPAELLPQDISSTWAQANPSGVGALKDRNFLQAGHHIGIDTVGQTLRNANLQLRSEPPNPQVQVSPFLNTTIEPDTMRRTLEVGGC